MIVTLEEAKTYLRIVGDEEDALIEALMNAAQGYLYNATGNQFSENNDLAKLFCLVLITDWYENREYIGTKVNEKVRHVVSSILAQLTFCHQPEETGAAP